MNKIAILIPTYNRPHKLKPLLENIKETCRNSYPYFIIDPRDKASINELEKLKEKYDLKKMEVKGEYRRAINFGFDNTSEPYIFLGADDILFTKGWEKKLLDVLKDDNICVTGGVDDWLCSRSGIHTSHPLVKRSYIKELGGAWGYRGKVYNPNRIHYHLDIELEQLAWSRGVIKICKECVIEHNHFVNKKNNRDATYDRSFNLAFRKDDKHYKKICDNFEYWDLSELHRGIAKPSPFRKKKLSIVMPIYNAKEYTLKTLDSLIKTTLNKWELIIIDDNSTQYKGYEFLEELEKRAYEGGFVTVKTIANRKQNYCNYNWNRGVKEATGDYICIINADIEFETEEWDDYLIENIELGYDLVSPYETNHVYKQPYGYPKGDENLKYLRIRGACFLFDKRLVKKAFPIPSSIKHWAGDNWISHKANDAMFDIRVVIHHYISQSGRSIKHEQFWKMVYKDIKSYKKLTGDKLVQPVLNNIERNLARYDTL